MSTQLAEQASAAAVTRLAALAPLDRAAHMALDQAIQRPRTFPARRDLLSEGQEVAGTLLILSGWAARIRILQDGRRQILNFLLPGDLVGSHDQERPVAASTVVAITAVDTAAAPSADVSPTLAQAYAISRALDEARLLSQITRLGRMTAHERMADLLLELLERLELAGLSVNGRYVMPLTQEIVADALGLTSVHLNRVLQALRREGVVSWKGRELCLHNPAALRRSIGRPDIRVSAG